MDTRLEITEAEVLEALAGGESPSQFKTRRELAKELNLPLNTVGNALRKLQDQGRLLVAQVPRAGLDGRLRPTAAYAVLAK
jgi:DNA-binding transcriptional regulator YhcF (GntR family)